MSIWRTWRGLILFLTFKFGIMYLMRVWIRKNIRDMEARGVFIPHVPE